MKFFTAELYARLNSSDDREFERANAEWHTALADYRRQVEMLAPHLSDGARELALNCRLHDAEVLAFGAEALRRVKWSDGPSLPVRAADFFTFSLLTESTATFIQYVLSRSVKSVRHVEFDVFATEKAFWLYDEIVPDAETMPAATAGVQAKPAALLPAAPMEFVHNVLLSNGLELEIPFCEVLIHSIPLSKIGSDVGALA